jgi:hypothetical protein
LAATDGRIEQRVCITFCVKLCKSGTETLEMLCEAFEEHSLSWTGIFQWLSRFKAGRLSIGNDECSGGPSTSKTRENFENSP